MSCRPRGPSDRPLNYYYDELELGAANAPRLPQQSIASRLLLASVVVCCCGIVAITVGFAISLVTSLPHVPAAAAIGPGAALVAIEQREGHPSPPPTARRAQRSVLARLATLKRAPAPETGADPHGMRLTFPHWFDGTGQLVTPVALGDITLALSYLAQEDVRERN